MSMASAIGALRLDIGGCPDWLVRDLPDRGELVRVLEGWTARAQD